MITVPARIGAGLDGPPGEAVEVDLVDAERSPHRVEVVRHRGRAVEVARRPELVRARLDGADLSGARVTADLTGASLVGASIADANLGADMRNQSMGLMRAVLKSANLERLNARGADLSRVDLEFSSLKDADLTGASLKRAQLGGADLTGVTVIDTDFDGADLASTRLIAPIGLDQAKNFDKARNSDRLIR